MKIDIIAPTLPPKLDGIGDYTARLARQLARSNDIRVLTTPGEYTPIDGVCIVPTFEYERRESMLRLPEVVSEPSPNRGPRGNAPDCVLLQYQPFSYGRWGLNPFLPMALRQIKFGSPAIGGEGGRTSTRVAVMVHEPFVPVLDVKHAIMTTWQRWQLWSLGRTADVVFFSIEPWVEEFRAWFSPEKVRHLPIASNIPIAPGDRDAVRASLGIRPSTIVLGLFGQAHSACLLDRIAASWSTLDREGIDAAVLYVGPQVQRVRENFPDVKLITTGALDAEDVSSHLAAMDIFLSPFVDGVSTRRGSMMAALEHGLPIVGTTAHHTDTILRRADGKSMMLAPADSTEAFVDGVRKLAVDRGLRRRMGVDAAEFYRRHFSWERIAESVVDAAQAKPSTTEWVQARELAAK